MEDRLDTNAPLVTFEVDLDKVNQAYRKSGIMEKMLEPLNEAQMKYLQEKELTVLQGRLLYLFKVMFENELEEREIRTAGLSFKSKMLKYARVAEVAFKQWCGRIGVAHLYHSSLSCGEDEISMVHRDVLACFDAAELTFRDDEVTCFSEEKGTVAKISLGCLSNSSGKTVYQRFVNLLRTLN